MRRSTKKDYTDFIRANIEVVYTSIDGDEFRARCPLHDEREPSFSINRNGLWYCHAEQRGGGIHSLRREMRQTSKRDADAAGVTFRQFGSAASR